ncbi:site-2 protease family protein [Streptomyces hainanensis]|uniref:Zinc metalloprotease n=1 Tax=Streptomyces hainanensis TaxID=402648 RepID=A0A4R4SQX2_9ACTN|nr:site-2 protease family protein [Streptomyces hainanensis]TDC66350.1 site-2 protease family protein [Streptomyces hainanensis]
MRATFMLGRIAGVRIGVNWSVLVIFALIAAVLAAGRLPHDYPGRGWVLYTLVGIGTALVFFASLLAHELAHAVVARRNGVEVEDIVLWLLGGATRMRSEAPTPGAEWRIAGVGPLVSLLLGGLFVVLTWLFHVAGASGLLVESAAWLATINVLLAVFNVIPAAPLDGGRLLRSFLWWRTGDRLRATTGAARAGQVFGWLLVGFGIWAFIWSAAFSALWLALIGWFLVLAATEEGRQARLRELLSGVAVRDTMTRDPVTVPSRETVGEFLSGEARAGRHSAFPVTRDRGNGEAERDDHHAVGLLTMDRAERVGQDDQRRLTVGEIMLPLDQTQVSRPDEPLSEAVTRMTPGPEHRLLVLDDEGHPVGIVAPSDVNRTVERITADHGGPAR